MNKKQSYLILGLLLSLIGLVQSCDKKDAPTVPSLGSSKVIDIKETEATFVFHLEKDGGGELLESGVCYGKNSNPTLNDSVAIYHHFIPQEYVDVYEGGESIMVLHNLEDGVKYYARAFAKNEMGIAYSDQKEFTTIASKLPKLSAELLSFDSRTATCKVSVIYDGGYEITEHGIVVSDNGPADLSWNIIKEVSGKGKGEFTVKINDLRWEKKYHLKAYAANENGTTYTEDIEFTTPTIYGSFTDERDGNVYRTLKVGSQTWMVDNLKYLPKVYPMEEGNPLQAYAYVRGYSGTDVNEAKGKAFYKDGFVYYNLVAAQLSCPEGWHLPTDKEWSELELAFGISEEETQRIGGSEKLKYTEISNIGFEMNFRYGYRLEGTNDGVGFLWPVDAAFWTNSEDEPGKFLFRKFGLQNDEMQIERWTIYKSAGLCVRCVKDE